YWQNADGSGSVERLTAADTKGAYGPESWSPDGKSLTLLGSEPPSISILSMDGDRKPKPLISGQSSRSSSFSPDGHWLAYDASDSAGHPNIFVEPFPPTGAKYQISTTG